jgi:3-oxoacyl-(acyl-carrier-protein) synthase
VRLKEKIMMRRVVITGIGPLCPGTSARSTFWKLLRDGATSSADSTSPSPLWQRVPESCVARRAGELRQMDAIGRLALAAVDLAIEDAEIDLSDLSPEQIGVSFGSGYGCLSTNLQYLQGILINGARFGNPIVFQNTVPNAATGYMSIAHGLRGPTATFSSGRVAGMEALDFAVHQIVEGHADTFVVASADCLCPQLVEAFVLRGHLSATGVARPLDRRRDGLLLSEAACGLVLEEYHAARRRGAPFYAEILGVGHWSDSGADRSSAVCGAVDDALHASKLNPGAIDVVFSSANGSVASDAWESRGLTGGLGACARDVPVTCPKSLMGETLGNGGTLAVALAGLAVSSGWVPGTAHFEEPDPECPLNVQPNGARHLVPETALVSSLGDDGNALVAVLGRCA